MSRSVRRLALFLVIAAAQPAGAAQDGLVPHTEIAGPTLSFDWPAIQIGIGSYEEGPTGLTIFRFLDRATATVDVRGGTPATVNSDALRLGYGGRFVDAIVFAGGSAYGEEAITSVASTLKEDGQRSGAWDDVAFVPGAVFYDFFGHRLNEIYPDKRLAQATLHALRPGVFPLGAQGGGRMAMQGSFFGCGAHSGQGGAFYRHGELKIAAFTLVSAVGTIADRDGKLVRCARDPHWGDIATLSELLALTGSQTMPEQPSAIPTRATTLSLIVVNRQMSYPLLQRLAVEVHTSMARAIQPFSTQDDGDTLFAVSTQELPAAASPLSTLQIDVIAAETMWNAVLASVPEEPAFTPPQPVALPLDKLARLAGRYQFGPHAMLDVALHDGTLIARASGSTYFDLKADSDVALVPISDHEFAIAGRYRTRLTFTIAANGKPLQAVLDPGRWEQHGERLSD